MNKENYESQPANILGSNYPLQENDARFQEETRNPKGYVVKNDKMPTIEFTQNREPAKVGTVDFSRPQGGYPNKLAESVDKVTPMNENLRAKWVQD